MTEMPPPFMPITAPGIVPARQPQGVVVPVQSSSGPLFRELDLARLNLVVELTEGYHLDEEALAMVMSLVDQLHGLRGDMRAILDAVAREPAETRVRLKAAIREVRVIMR